MTIQLFIGTDRLSAPSDILSQVPCVSGTKYDITGQVGDIGTILLNSTVSAKVVCLYNPTGWEVGFRPTGVTVDWSGDESPDFSVTRIKFHR